MTTSTLNPSKRLSPVVINLTVSVLLTTFLFYIDEGYYNFNWTRNIGNWIMFVVYAGSMFLGQTLTEKFILKKYTGNSKSILTSLIGIPLGVLILFAFGFSIKYLFSLS